VDENLGRMRQSFFFFFFLSFFSRFCEIEKLAIFSEYIAKLVEITQKQKVPFVLFCRKGDNICWEKITICKQFWGVGMHFAFFNLENTISTCRERFV
jgi:isochorismate hydrolase